MRRPGASWGWRATSGPRWGSTPRFAYQAIKQVGNYGDIWGADIGPSGVARGLNRLWNKGGLMYAPPIR